MYRMSQMSQSVRSVRYCVRFGRYRSKPLTETDPGEFAYCCTQRMELRAPERDMGLPKEHNY